MPIPHDPGPVPDAAARDVIAVGRATVLAALDALRPRLLDTTGRTGRTDKADGSPITALDLEADRVLTAAIRGALPTHDVLSEEASTTWDGTEWTWVIDPIDGTTNFAAGLPWWATSVALALDGQVVWGLVDMPGMDQRVEATRGSGTTRNGQRVQVRAPVDLQDRASRHVPMAVSAGTVRRVRPRTYFKPRVLGAYAADLAMVSTGVLAGAFLRVPNAWDVAAGVLCVTEAGGVVVSFDEPAALPLVPGIDTREVVARTVAGPTVEWVTDARARLWPDNW